VDVEVKMRKQSLIMCFTSLLLILMKKCPNLFVVMR